VSICKLLVTSHRWLLCFLVYVAALSHLRRVRGWLTWWRGRKRPWPISTHAPRIRTLGLSRTTKTSVRLVSLRAGIEPGTSTTRNRSANHSVSAFGVSLFHSEVFNNAVSAEFVIQRRMRWECDHEWWVVTISAIRLERLNKTTKTCNSTEIRTSYISPLNLQRYRDANLLIPFSIHHILHLQVFQLWATGWTTGVRFPAGARVFPLRHRVQIGSGTNPASYPMGTGGSLPGNKEAGAWSWPLTSI
jgi:hypothetical protein